MKINTLTSESVIRVLSSHKFFWATVALLVIQSAWIALSSRYPMAFDEDFHLGLIKLYAEHGWPFWGSHPSGGDAFGALARDPSYLYHYLMSFPYRFIGIFSDSQAVQVLALRGLNIAFLASALPLFRQLLLKTGASRAIVNVTLLAFVLIPIVPFLGAQINYDNVIMPITAALLLLALRFVKRSTGKTLDIKSFMALLTLGLLASLVKYAFLPIFVAVMAYVFYAIFRKKGSLKNLKTAALKAWQRAWGWPLALSIFALILASGLFAERYAVNIVRYQTPVPDCAQVLTYNECQYYGPWIRDYNLEKIKGDFNTSPIHYTDEWLRGMWLRSFFAVDGPATDFETKGPLTMPGISSIVFAGVSALAFIYTARRLWRKYNVSVLWLMAGVSGLYIAVLWLTEYQLYLQTAKPVAINGRYLLPVLPFVFLLSGLAVNELVRSRRWAQVLTAGIVIGCLAWGGGALTYILRSQDVWYWDNRVVRTVNHAIQDTLGPVTPGYNSPSQYLPYAP